MEKGIVKSFDKDCGMGTICRLANKDIKFYMDSVVDKARAGIKQGDQVWFDLGKIEHLNIAVNIKKYL